VSSKTERAVNIVGPIQGDRSVAGCGFGAVKEVDAMGEPASGRGRPEAAYRW